MALLTRHRLLTLLRRFLSIRFSFLTLHYIYFITTCLISAVIFWGSSTPPRSVSFVDSLFLTVSAMTLAGLNTVNLSTLNTFQQIMLFLLIIIGSAIFVSAFVVQVRRAAFEKVFRDVVEKRASRQRRRSRSRKGRGSSISLPRLRGRGREGEVELEQTGLGIETGGGEVGVDGQSELPQQPRHDKSQTREEITMTPPLMQSITFSPESSDAVRRRHDGTGGGPYSRHSRSDILQPQQPGLHHTRTQSSVGSLTLHSSHRPPSEHHASSTARYFESFGGWISRNSQFHGLTEKEREQLGGYEYRAVSFLAWVVPTYFVLWQLLGCLGCGAWVALNQPDTARENGLNPWWVGAFNAVSAFNNSGMSLLDANMVAFQTSVYMLLTMGLLILAGNTCYPIFLRLIVWCMYKLVSHLGLTSPVWAERAQTLRFLLDHPRRCYTNLFPAQHTWWLLLAVIILNGTDWAAFEILNIGNTALFEGQAIGTRVIDGLFQALAVRSGGFYVVTITNLRIAVQVLYVVMMYISVYPVVITMRNSNVYEERSLGIYAEDEYDRYGVSVNNGSSNGNGKSNGVVSMLADHLVPQFLRRKSDSTSTSNSQFVQQQLRAQLAHDAWTIVVALFLIMIVEGQQFANNPVVFSVFNFLFEIVSGYGCVGISVGVPDADYSFCGSWHALSKLILCVVMLRGRHRGLPVAIDKAISLPGDRMGGVEEDDGRIRLARSLSRGPQERRDV